MSRAKLLTVVKKSLPYFVAVIFAFGALCLYHPFRREVRIVGQTTLAHLSSPVSGQFPVIPTARLSPLQRRIVDLTQQEYTKKPVSYDGNVLKYSQGSKEPWCADFASWIFMQAGRPFDNPNSGSWRIPGVYTLQEYFQAYNTYKMAGTYVPKTGDVAIYHQGEGHTNIVLTVKNGQMTTVGGNESGRIRIETQSYAKGADGLDGFGVLSTH